MSPLHFQKREQSLSWKKMATFCFSQMFIGVGRVAGITNFSDLSANSNFRWDWAWTMKAKRMAIITKEKEEAIADRYDKSGCLWVCRGSEPMKAFASRVWWLLNEQLLSYILVKWCWLMPTEKSRNLFKKNFYKHYTLNYMKVRVKQNEMFRKKVIVHYHC